MPVWQDCWSDSVLVSNELIGEPAKNFSNCCTCSIAQTHNVVMLYNAHEWLWSCWRTWSTTLSAIHSLLTVPLGICKKKMQTETLTIWFDDSFVGCYCGCCNVVRCASPRSARVLSQLRSARTLMSQLRWTLLDVHWLDCFTRFVMLHFFRICANENIPDVGDLFRFRDW